MDPYWNPLWALLEESHLSLNLHIGGGGSQGVGLTGVGAYAGHSPMLQLADGSTKSFSANTQIMEHFPRLMIVSSESVLGWVPYLLETADHQWERQKLWQEGVAMKPSEYFHRQCYVNLWFEVIGIKMREYIGLDNIMWGSDYPHPTCTYPDSQDFGAGRPQAKEGPADAAGRPVEGHRDAAGPWLRQVTTAARHCPQCLKQTIRKFV